MSTRPRVLRVLTSAVAALAPSTVAVSAADDADPYIASVRPFLEEYCVDCHGSRRGRADLDLESYTSSAGVVADFRRWSHVIEFIRGGAMPPQDEVQPSLDERRDVVRALEEILLEEAERRAGDPGVVLPRRLSASEYDLAIRDLTGVDIRPAHDFPVDPAGGEGFDNTGEALAMTPSLLRKYLTAARRVSEHLVLGTRGVRFAPFPVTSYAERRKLTEEAIIDFYAEREPALRDHVRAAWELSRLERGDAERQEYEAQLAARGLSPRYVRAVHDALEQLAQTDGALARLGATWRSLSAPSVELSPEARLDQLVRGIELFRERLHPRPENLIRAGAGNWPIEHLAFRDRMAERRDRYVREGLRADGFARSEPISSSPSALAPGEEPSLTVHVRVDPATAGAEGAVVVLHGPVFSRARDLPRNDEEAEAHGVVSLRDILAAHAPDAVERVGFGARLGRDGESDSALILSAPAHVEIELPAAAVRELDGKRLLASFRVEEGAGSGAAVVQVSIGARPTAATVSGAVLVAHPNGSAARELTEAAEVFCRVFPSRFAYVHERRGLAAGFHLVDGFFRDDRPLVRTVLSESEREELDRLWEELEFVTSSAETLLRGFVWFERAERHVLHDARFDFLRSEDPRLVEREMLARFERVYLEKMGVELMGADGDDADDTSSVAELAPRSPSARFDLIHGFFEDVRRGLARQRALLRTAEERALGDLLDFARRAYRRPLREGEADAIRRLHRDLREDRRDAESALRGVLTAVLMSPHFSYRVTEAPPGDGIEPLSSDDLASRLSFFLWSSVPDEALLDAAARDELGDEEALVRQLRRMTRSPKIEALARELFGQWLRFRDYPERDPINAGTFAGYDDELRRSMAEEPVRLITHLIREDRPVTELLTSDATFLDARLARHYGGALAERYRDLAGAGAVAGAAGGSPWVRVDGLRAAGRGGLLGMGVILTTTSAGERTSPVKRGFWTAHHLLGQHFPPPPAEVPELPASESDAPKTIREMLADHAADASCAMCHTHFDGFGVALESFDAVGRIRERDLAGRTIDDRAELPSGEVARGVAGVVRYVEEHRRSDFIRTLCRKTLGYALGRSVELSDQPLIAAMEERLAASGYRFSALLESVVRSPQFRLRRGRDFLAQGE